MSQKLCLSGSSSVGALVCIFGLFFGERSAYKLSQLKCSASKLSWNYNCMTLWLDHSCLLHPLCPETKALIKTAKYGISFLKLTEHKSLSERPQDTTLAVTGNRKYLLPPGSQSQTSDYYTICSSAQTQLRQDVPWCLRLKQCAVWRWDKIQVANQRRRADLPVRSLFQAWQLIGSSRKLWYAMANWMLETDQEVVWGISGWWAEKQKL